MYPFPRAADNFVLIDWGIGVPYIPNFVMAIRVNFQKIKCIMEIPRESIPRGYPEGSTPSRSSVLSSYLGESSSSLIAL